MSGPASSKIKIRKQTDNLLEHTPFTPYAPIEKTLISDILLNVGAFSTLSDGRPDPYLTGASQAALPMTFVVKAKNGDRLEYTLLINPESLNYSKTGSVQSTYTRMGYITQMWGVNQDLITSNGRTAAFMVEGIGLTSFARKRSFSYANFLALISIYRDNGYQFADPTKLRNNLTNVIERISGVELYYDSQTFMGHFNNFSIDEDAEHPFLFNYNFEFVVSTRNNNYNEVKGHFSPIVKEKENDTPVILEDLKSE